MTVAVTFPFITRCSHANPIALFHWTVVPPSFLGFSGHFSLWLGTVPVRDVVLSEYGGEGIHINNI